MKKCDVLSKAATRYFFSWVLGLAVLTGAFIIPAYAVTNPAPSFLEKDLNGQMQSLSQYSGKTVVVYFWASWCPYCRKDLPNMIKVYEQFQARGVKFLSVSLDKDEAKLRQFVEERRIPYPVIFRGEAWDNKIASVFNVTGIPTFVIVRPDGSVAAMDVGSAKLEEVLPQYL